jgi:hypothetical protein
VGQQQQQQCQQQQRAVQFNTAWQARLMQGVRSAARIKPTHAPAVVGVELADLDAEVGEDLKGVDVS